VLVIVFFGYVCLVANAGATGTDRDIDNDGQWDRMEGE